MSRVFITDVTLRDGHQCLIATRMRTDDMLPICKQLDQVGFWSLEVWGGATFDACLRFLKEDPWERLRQLRGALPNSRLQMLLRGQNLLGYRHYADDVVRAFVRSAADNGVDVFRVFDALNDARNMRVSLEAVKAAGKHAQGTLCYTSSPVHTTAGFVELAKELQAMGCDSIAIKDMAALLTPHATAELVSALGKAVSVPVHLHSHSTSGLGEMCHLKAIENGCRHIETAFTAFAGGASHPPTESMVAALQGTEYDTGLDLAALQNINAQLRTIRKKYHQFESEYTGVDSRVQYYQVPGGMLSNLANQLREQGALERMEEVFAEIPRVRKDLGYPPLVTPTSQVVGAQAVMNVLTGERYRTVTKEVKQYLLGAYGRAPAPVDPSVQKRAIGEEEPIVERPADRLGAEYPRLKEEIGVLAESETDVLLYAMFPDVGRQFLQQRAAGELTPEPLEPASTERPVMASQDAAPTEFHIAVHGEQYHVRVTGAGRKNESKRYFYLTVDGQPEEILVETLDEVLLTGGATGAIRGSAKEGIRPPASKPGHVSVTMPCAVVEVRVGVGDRVEAGTPVLVTEAMKMETEAHAPISGIVSHVYVAKGDRVVPGEALIEIEAPDA
jgi:pyruvate carboxylase subunit B